MPLVRVKPSDRSNVPCITLGRKSTTSGDVARWRLRALHHAMSIASHVMRVAQSGFAMRV